MELSSELVAENEDSESPFLGATALRSVTTIAIVMCTLGAIFYCYEYYLRVAPSVMREELKAAFLLNEKGFGSLCALYYYAYTPMQIPVGMMMDRFGPRRILTLACLLCTVGTYLFAATNILSIAQIGRFLVGFGSAFAYVGVLKISNEWLPKKYFALMAGLCSALGMFGAISGEISMSYLVESFGWQSTLNYSMIVGAILTLILWMVIREKNEHRSIEVSEFTVKQEYSKGEKLTEISIEKYTAEVEVPRPLKHVVTRSKLQSIKEILLNPQMWLIGIIGCLTFLPLSGFAEAWAVSFLESVGLNSHQAAMGSSMIFLGFAFGGPCFGWLSDKIHSRRIPLIIGSFGSAILMALIVFMPSNSLLWMYSLLFMMAFFAGAEILIFAVSNDLTRNSVSATAAAFTNMLTMLGGMILPKLIGKSLDNALKLSDSAQALTPQDYSVALMVLPIGLVVAGILSILLKESYTLRD